MISKELLSEVLNENVSSIVEVIGNKLYYLDKNAHTKSVNIYELAFKCKEWAIKQGYNIRTESYDYLEDDSFNGTYWWVLRLRPKKWQEQGCPNCGANGTEPDGIFKACEWILENKDIR